MVNNILSKSTPYKKDFEMVLLSKWEIPKYIDGPKYICRQDTRLIAQTNMNVFKLNIYIFIYFFSLITALSCNI